MWTTPLFKVGLGERFPRFESRRSPHKSPSAGHNALLVVSLGGFSLLPRAPIAGSGPSCMYVMYGLTVFFHVAACVHLSPTGGSINSLEFAG